MKQLLFAFVSFLLFLGSCSKELTFTSDFNDCNDRIWIGRDYWTIPLEDWKISEERVECVPSIRRARMNLLTRVLSPVEGDFELSVHMFALRILGTMHMGAINRLTLKVSMHTKRIILVVNM